jgi:hypothetical protein
MARMVDFAQTTPNFAAAAAAAAPIPRTAFALYGMSKEEPSAEPDSPQDDTGSPIEQESERLQKESTGPPY